MGFISSNCSIDGIKYSDSCSLKNTNYTAGSFGNSNYNVNSKSENNFTTNSYGDDNCDVVDLDDLAPSPTMTEIPIGEFQTHNVGNGDTETDSGNTCTTSDVADTCTTSDVVDTCTTGDTGPTTDELDGEDLEKMYSDARIDFFHSYYKIINYNDDTSNDDWIKAMKEFSNCFLEYKNQSLEYKKKLYSSFVDRGGFSFNDQVEELWIEIDDINRDICAKEVGILILKKSYHDGGYSENEYNDSLKKMENELTDLQNDLSDANRRMTEAKDNATGSYHIDMEDFYLELIAAEEEYDNISEHCDNLGKGGIQEDDDIEATYSELEVLSLKVKYKENCIHYLDNYIRTLDQFTEGNY